MTEKIKYIRKVFKNNLANQKLVTVPKNSDIQAGDFVSIIKEDLKEIVCDNCKRKYIVSIDTIISVCGCGNSIELKKK